MYTLWESKLGSLTSKQDTITSFQKKVLLFFLQKNFGAQHDPTAQEWCIRSKNEISVVQKLNTDTGNQSRMTTAAGPCSKSGSDLDTKENVP